MPSDSPAILQPLFNLVNRLCEPVTFYTLAIVVFFLVLYFRKFLVQPVVAASIALLTIVFLGLSLFNEQFYREATKSDNAPIWIMLALTSVCMWSAFSQMVNNDERRKKGLKSDEWEVSQEKLHVWPYLVYIEGIIAAFVLALLFLWSLGLDAPLEMFANPAKSPNPAKAPWYFLGLQELLVYFDPWIAGVVLPGMIVVGLIMLPYCDPNPRGVGYYTFEERRFAITTYLFGYVMMWLVLIFVGTFLRGQNWNFFGLYEPWDPHKVLSSNNINLSDFFWQDIHKMIYGNGRSPKDFAWYIREIPGFVVLGVYFIGSFLLVPLLFKGFVKSFTDYYGKWPGRIRFFLVLFFLVVMLAVPIKMYLRWAINLKYIVFIPEYFTNI